MAVHVTCALYDGCALCCDRLLTLSMPCLFMVILICMRDTAWCTVHPKVFNDKALLRADGNLVTRPEKEHGFFL
uniref:Putative secreted protein n=1 Tax=Amblyomma cajennense TaxID=34607 RepID=A0A023FDE3_AMBCJ